LIFTHGSTKSEPRFIPYQVISVLRRLESPIRLRGTLHGRYKAPLVIQYLDTETGEILAADEAKTRPGFWPELHFSERFLQREEILRNLRVEVRHFARFVLKFRNLRRGITPGIDKLVKWYAELHKKKPHHVRRYVGKLKEAGVLAGEALLAPLFQRPGLKIRAAGHIAEDAIAALQFACISIERCQPKPRHHPFWYQQYDAGMQQILDQLMRRIERPRRFGGWEVESYECQLEDEQFYQ
jgi:hypothetical protein